MKDYPKTYENFFFSASRTEKCKPDLIGVANDEMSLEEYMSLIQKTAKEKQKTEWSTLLKLTWLFRKFVYNGRRRKSIRGNGVILDAAFAVFIQNYLGYNNRILSGNKVHSALSTYFDELYPDFESVGPFKAEYPYPYNYMNFECLLFVYLMPERLQLLEAGEQKAMTYGQFGDYILNYTQCYNQEHGDTYILSSFDSRVPFPHMRLYENAQTVNPVQK